MMFVLDTNVVSELRKVRAGKADANVTAWTESVDAADLFVSAITIMELELGVLSIERTDATQGAMLRSGWSNTYCPSSPAARCLSILPWRCAAPACMYPTSAVSAMHSLRQQPLCMA